MGRGHRANLCRPGAETISGRSETLAGGGGWLGGDPGVPSTPAEDHRSRTYDDGRSGRHELPSRRRGARSVLDRIRPGKCLHDRPITGVAVETVMVSCVRGRASESHPRPGGDEDHTQSQHRCTRRTRHCRSLRPVADRQTRVLGEVLGLLDTPPDAATPVETAQMVDAAAQPPRKRAIGKIPPVARHD